jgi:nucleoside-diphosphate-sugar epimerase
MARVLITGADGFTGRYLAAELRRAGVETHGLVRSPIALNDFAAVYVADLADSAALLRVIQQVQPTHVAHLAAISFVAHGQIDEIYAVNLLGTRHLLSVLASSGVPVQSVLLASSANIYGNSFHDAPLTEATSAKPANDYAVSKLAMEHMAQLYRDRLPLVVVRPFNYTGVGQAPSFLLPKIVGHFKQRAPVIELGNLDVARDFSDVRVICELYHRLLETSAAIGQTFNVCSGKAFTLDDVLQMAREISGHEIEVRVNPAFVRANEVKRLVGSRAKLESVVGAVADVPLRETLRWMLEAD